jgi:hypothetical protein
MPIHCDICNIDYKDDNILGKPNMGFSCNCTPNMCIPCITLLCMNDIKPVAGSANVGIVLEQDPEYNARCPFCRKDVDPFIKAVFRRGPIYDMLLAIKICRFLGKQSDVDDIRNNYKASLGYDCPI